MIHQCYQQDIPVDLRGEGMRSAESLTSQGEDKKQSEEFILEQRLSQVRDLHTYCQCLEDNERQAYEVKTCYRKGESMSKALSVDVNKSKCKEMQTKAAKTKS